MYYSYIMILQQIFPILTPSCKLTLNSSIINIHLRCISANLKVNKIQHIPNSLFLTEQAVLFSSDKKPILYYSLLCTFQLLILSWQIVRIVNRVTEMELANAIDKKYPILWHIRSIIYWIYYFTSNCLLRLLVI